MFNYLPLVVTVIGSADANTGKWDLFSQQKCLNTARKTHKQLVEFDLDFSRLVEVVFTYCKISFFSTPLL